MTTNRPISRKWMRGLAATAFVAALVHSLPLGAQGVIEQEAVDRIVDSEVKRRRGALRSRR